MKLTTQQTKRAKGMTLLELTVVILVLLSLISILFIGARAWKKGSDRSANILNVRNVQQAVRGHANMHSLEAAATLNSSVIFDDFNYMEDPVNGPNGTAYTYLDAVPEIGQLYITNPELGGSDGEYFYSNTADPEASGYDPATDADYTEVSEW